MPTALVTGSAGFIGYFISEQLLREGWTVVGIDSMNDYYDVSLKQARRAMLEAFDGFSQINEKIEAPNVMMDIFETHRPDYVIHLAAQAGVRYSIDNPRAYFESNLGGTFEILEAARAYPPKHMLLASTSSAYGANEVMPYHEPVKADHQVSFYAATKKSTENMAHSYAHLFDLPITMFRFFTVYGPWGRPDMALFKFTKAVLEGHPIDVYNRGKMRRDFTYISDLVQAVRLLMDAVPVRTVIGKAPKGDSLSPVAPFRVVNIGNNEPIELMKFIEAIEEATGSVVQKNFLPLQPGEVLATWADTTLLHSLTGYQTTTNISQGVSRFVQWYRDFYRV